MKRTSELRKIEQELAYERKIQKERETEDETFADKDAFMTGAYRKKLEERAEIEEKLRREEEIESEFIVSMLLSVVAIVIQTLTVLCFFFITERNDVTKEKDLSRLYRHLLHQKTSHPITTNQNIVKEKSDKNVTKLKDVKKNVIDEDIKGEERMAVERGESQSEERVPPALPMETNLPLSEDVDEVELSHTTFKQSSDVVDQHTGETKPEESIEISEEEKRKRFFLKRTSDAAATSAKERYLARKRAKVSQPVTVPDD